MVGQKLNNIHFLRLVVNIIIILILISVVTSSIELSVFAQNQNVGSNGIQNGSSATVLSKSDLTPSEKKLNYDLQRLVIPSMLQGESMGEKKAQMESMNQLIPAQAVAAQDSTMPIGDLVHVYISFEPDADVKRIESYTWNVTGIDLKDNLMVAWVDENDILPLASLSDVRNIEAVMPPMVNVVTQGDTIHRSVNVRSLSGYTGAGMKIGVISDGVDHLNTSIANGELPSNVHVLSNTKGGDEGTAILEVVHDMAPDAELYFHDYGDDWLGFNRAVDELINNGSTVVIDDIAWYTTPFFQDGVIASNITDQVNNRNIVYVTSADNFAMGHYQGTYYDDGTGNADLSHGTSSYKTIYYDIPAYRSIIVVLEWNDTWGASSNDYDFYLRNATTNAKLAGSASMQNGTQNPIEYFGYYNANSYPVRVALDVENYSAPQPRMLEIMTITGGIYAESYNLNASDSIFGHAAAANVISAGAIAASDPGNNDIEYFSSRGPVTIYYPSYEVRSKPNICGIDGVSISGAGGFSNPFYGTSAAAPHIGAIAALIWSAYPTASANTIRNWLYWSAVDLGTTGPDNVFGYGRADALNMFLLPNGTITGYVNITGIGVRIPNANVSLINASNNSQVFASTTTDPDGKYVFNNISSVGNLPVYKLSVQRSDFNDNGSSSFAVAPDAINWMNVSMTSTAPMPVIQLNATGYRISENAGILYVNVTRTNDFIGTVGVTLTTVPGTATSPSDYTAITTPVTFVAGQMSNLTAISINCDHLYSQCDDQFIIQISDPAGGATLGLNQSATVTLTETDPAPVLNFSAVSYNFSDNQSVATITVNRLNDAVNPVTVQYNTSNGTAWSGSNYTATNGTLTFNQSEMSHTIQVPILGSQGSNVTFNVTLSNSTGDAILGTPNGVVVTIVKTTYTFTFDLKKGWNIISVPFVPLHSNVTDIFPSSALNNIDVIWIYNTSKSSPWEYYTPRTDIYNQGTLKTIDEKHGYYVYCYNATSFQVSGTPVDESLTLVNGWNLIGNPSMTSRAPWDLYSGVDVIWEYNGSNSSPWSYYTSRTDIYDQGSLTIMKPGYGYLIYK